MTDAELAAALRELPPVSRVGGMALFSESLLEGAGIDPAHAGRWATGHGGGTMQAGELKLRKGQRPEQARPGRPQAFVAVPLGLLG